MDGSGQREKERKRNIVIDMKNAIVQRQTTFVKSGKKQPQAVGLLTTKIGHWQASQHIQGALTSISSAICHRGDVASFVQLPAESGEATNPPYRSAVSESPPVLKTSSGSKQNSQHPELQIGKASWNIRKHIGFQLFWGGSKIPPFEEIPAWGVTGIEVLSNEVICASDVQILGWSFASDTTGVSLEGLKKYSHFA